MYISPPPSSKRKPIKFNTSSQHIKSSWQPIHKLHIPMAAQPSTTQAGTGKIFNERIHPAIRTFLRSVQLDGAQGRDNQLHPNAYEKHGTIILPLAKQTEKMNYKSSNWNAFNEFLEALKPLLAGITTLLMALHRKEYDQASAILQKGRGEGYNPTRDINPLVFPNCFETVRLSANLALDVAPLTTSHKSQIAMIVPIGEYTGGDIVGPESKLITDLKAGELHVWRGGTSIGNLGFQGERYQLEFFLPNLEESEELREPGEVRRS